MQHAEIVGTDSVLSQVENLIGEIAPLTNSDEILRKATEFLCGIDGVLRSGALITSVTTVPGTPSTHGPIGRAKETAWFSMSGRPSRQDQIVDGSYTPPQYCGVSGERLFYRFEDPLPTPPGISSRDWEFSNSERLAAGDVDVMALPLVGTAGPIGAFWIIGDQPGGLRNDLVKSLEVLGSVVAMTLEKVHSVNRAASQLEEISTLNEKLAVSNRDFQSFAQMASSDLQDPLRKIITFGDRLERSAVEELNDRELDYLARIHSASDRMQRLINDLLTFSSVHTNDVSDEPVDLELVIVDVLSDLEVAIADASATVKIGTLPTVRGNATQLRQLFQNLIGNAIKFRAEGVPPRIEVGFVQRTPTFFEITVADNGIGFDAKFIEKIFRPFQRLHGTADYSGSGIGLSVCKRIANRHGGWLTAQSKEGEGATFGIHLPVPAHASQNRVTP